MDNGVTRRRFLNSSNVIQSDWHTERDRKNSQRSRERENEAHFGKFGIFSFASAPFSGIPLHPNHITTEHISLILLYYHCARWILSW